MVGLLDIAPLDAQTVRIRGKDISVRGIDIHGIAYLIKNHPSIRRLMSGQDVSKNFTADALFDLVPNLVGEIIAAGIGFPGDEKQAAAASNLSIGEQLELLEPIITLTLPGGPVPFANALQRILAVGLKDIPQSMLMETAPEANTTTKPQPPKRQGAQGVPVAG